LNDKNRRRTAYEHVIRIAQDNNASNHKKEIGEAYGFIGLDQLLDATSNNEWERPVETLKKAIANNPDLPSQSDLRTWLGQSEMYLYFKKVKETGDRKGNDFLKQDACSEFNKVLKIDPRSTNAKNGKEKLDCP
jgi:tetratricopeptide (TPR) repeat protein